MGVGLPEAEAAAVLRAEHHVFRPDQLGGVDPLIGVELGGVHLVERESVLVLLVFSHVDGPNEIISPTSKSCQASCSGSAWRAPGPR